MPSEKTDYVFDPARPTIVVTRVFDAPRRLVWDAMTKPEYLKRWYGPPENESTYEVDLRPGGSHRFANKSQWGEFVSTGLYREVTPPERLVYTSRSPQLPFQECVVTTTLEEKGGKTTMTTTTVFASIEDRDGFVKMPYVTTGNTASLDRLEKLLGDLAGAKA
jgi:uncharacterized protein YndB with AHSA1/START domain